MVLVPDGEDQEKLDFLNTTLSDLKYSAKQSNLSVLDIVFFLEWCELDQ